MMTAVTCRDFKILICMLGLLTWFRAFKLDFASGLGFRVDNILWNVVHDNTLWLEQIWSLSFPLVICPIPLPLPSRIHFLCPFSWRKQLKSPKAIHLETMKCRAASWKVSSRPFPGRWAGMGSLSINTKAAEFHLQPFKVSSPFIETSTRKPQICYCALSQNQAPHGWRPSLSPL